MNELGLSLIQVGDRRREDMGDIDSLADSINRYGLLHPVVIDADDRLVAGGRRLAAVKQLGWLSVPVRRLNTLTDVELREIELEENLRRKDLTPIEASRNMVALAEVIKETRADSAQVSRNGSRGPSPSPTSDRQVAAEMGIGATTLREAREHVAAVEANPDLATLPQAEAIRQHRTITRPLDPDIVEKGQRDTAVTLIDRCLYTFETNIEDIPTKLDWILETRDLTGNYGPLTATRFEQAATYCAAFAAELRKRGIDG